MSKSPVVHIKGSRYGLLINMEEETVMKSLSTIPGLRINEQESRAEGSIDAVAAACHRLRIGLPGWSFPPVTAQYPEVLNLKNYQKEGVFKTLAIAKAFGGAILADDMGLGKTRQAIAFALNHKGRYFIVCPAYVRDTWAAELTKLGETSHVVLEPAATKAQKKAWETAENYRWVITSYALADRAYSAAFASQDASVLLIDEFHNLRGRDAKRSQECKGIAAQVTAKLGLTGTPQWSRLRDWWMLLSIMYGSTFGGKYDFDKAYCNGRLSEHGGWDNFGATNTEELKARLSYYMIRRTKADVASELPKLTRQVIWCDGTKEATAAFHRALSTKDSVARYQAFEATLAGKIEPALEIAAEAKQFLLFTYLKTHAHQMAKVLAEQMDTPCVCLTGDIVPAKRQALVRDAVARKIGVVATIDAAGTGIDGLQKTISVGIMHCLDPVPIKMAQAEGRLDRIGQTLPVNWYYLGMKDSHDSLMIKTVVSKMDQTRSVLGSNEQRELRNALSDSANLENVGDALAALYESME